MTESAPPSRPVGRWLGRLEEPVDIASLAVFRMLFGLLGFVGSLRFLLNGWVDRFFVEPGYHFHYWGFEWVTALPSGWMHGVFVALCVLSVMIAVGWLYRPAIVAFFLLFTYVELIDVANYLNHYYLVSLLALLLVFLPASGAWSLDARVRPSRARATIPRWMVWLLRAQVAVVYFYAGVAKLNTDWLLHAQPMNIWLSSRTETPLIGPWLDWWEVALAMSWAGFLYDTTIWIFLSIRRTRPYAYATVLVFHGLTGVFFAIGMFPVIMAVATTVFFRPDWPRRIALLARRAAANDRAVKAPPRPARRLTPHRGWLAAAAVFLVVQVVVPARWLAYGGNVAWHEQGMRWAWKVMLREKNGSVTYRVSWDGREGERLVFPSRYLSDHQEREMSGQPDLILQLAHHVGTELREAGHTGVEVYADAWVSWNGRPAARLIDPGVDLMEVRDGIARARWVLPAPMTPPARLMPADGRVEGRAMANR